MISGNVQDYKSVPCLTVVKRNVQLNSRAEDMDR